MTKQLTINLLKKKGTPSLDVFIKWAITGGRFLVILTETIALAAFLYRFTLDRQIIDLHDKIKAKTRIVETFKEQEDSYRQLQERLLQTKKLNTDVAFLPLLLEDITLLAQKNNISIKSMSVSNNSLHIELVAFDIKNLRDFVGGIQEKKELSEVSIDRIENKSTTAQIAAVISSGVLGKSKLEGEKGAKQ
ncbi:MAG: hypothetical protein HZC02_03240 [Candidatus Levybacteria bacterium]|nr:hypothetical protein [Candidatus Levybacteria bacterium]